MPPVNDINNLKTQVAKDNQKQLAAKIRSRVGLATFIVVGVFATIAAGVFGLGVSGILVAGAFVAGGLAASAINEAQIRKIKDFNKNLESLGNEMQADNKENNDDIELEVMSKKISEKEKSIITENNTFTEKIYAMKEKYLGPNKNNNFGDMKNDRDALAGLIQNYKIQHRNNKIKLNPEEKKIFRELEDQYALMKNDSKLTAKITKKNAKKSEKFEKIRTEKEIDGLYRTVNNFINKPDKRGNINLKDILDKLDILIGNSGTDKHLNRKNSMEKFKEESQNISFVSKAKLDTTLIKIKAMISKAEIIEKNKKLNTPQKIEEQNSTQKNVIKMK